MLWDDREDFHPQGQRLQRVDQEAYCDVPRRVTKVKPVGEQADYELDRILAGPVWDSAEDHDYYEPPRRIWARRPELIPADPLAFDDLTAPVLEAVVPRQMELLEWPGV